MSEDTTQNIPDGGSFEERVFARFDSLDARIQALESQAERRALETKPIWERALAEIGEVKVELGEVKERLGALEELTKPMLRKIDLLNRDMLTLRAEQIGLENRLDKLEPNVS
jgi:chromosome segregation ATPase